MGSPTRMHRCGIPRCGMWTHPTNFACHQHRAIMGWRMAADIDQRWNER